MEKRKKITTFNFKRYYVTLYIEKKTITARLNGDGEDLFDAYIFPTINDDDCDLSPEEEFELVRIICKELENKGIDKKEKIILPEVEWENTPKIKTTLIQKFIAKNMIKEKHPDSLRKLGVMFRAEGDIQKEEQFKYILGDLIPSAYLPSTYYIYTPVLRSVGKDRDGNLALLFRTNGFNAGTTTGSYYVGNSIKELANQLSKKAKITVYANPYLQIIILKEGDGIENFYLDHGGTFGYGTRGWSYFTCLFFARQIGATPVCPLIETDYLV